MKHQVAAKLLVHQFGIPVSPMWSRMALMIRMLLAKTVHSLRDGLGQPLSISLHCTVIVESVIAF
jgi:hypothetical protein